MNRNWKFIKIFEILWHVDVGCCSISCYSVRCRHLSCRHRNSSHFISSQSLKAFKKCSCPNLLKKSLSWVIVFVNIHSPDPAFILVSFIATVNVVHLLLQMKETKRHKIPGRLFLLLRFYVSFSIATPVVNALMGGYWVKKKNEKKTTDNYVKFNIRTSCYTWYYLEENCISSRRA